LTVADFFNAPSVDEVDLSGYGGAVGDQIVIQASDDFGALGVNVALTDGAGSPLALRQAQDASRKAAPRSKRLPIAAAGSTAPPAQSPPARPYASPSLPATAPAARAKPHKRRLSKKIGPWRRAISMPVLGLPCAILEYAARVDSVHHEARSAPMWKNNVRQSPVACSTFLVGVSQSSAWKEK